MRGLRLLFWILSARLGVEVARGIGAVTILAGACNERMLGDRTTCDALSGWYILRMVSGVAAL